MTTALTFAAVNPKTFVQKQSIQKRSCKNPLFCETRTINHVKHTLKSIFKPKINRSKTYGKQREHPPPFQQNSASVNRLLQKLYMLPAKMVINA